MLNVMALTSGRNTPSSRYRIRQHIPGLNDLGVHVTEWHPVLDRYAESPLGFRPVWKAIKAAATLPAVIKGKGQDLIWLERTLCPGLLTFEPLLNRPYVLDIDDAVWLTPPFGESALAAVARRASAVVAGNRYIARYLRRYHDRIFEVPTAVDTDRFRPIHASHPKPDRFMVGWSGTHSNLTYLYEIEPALHRFLKDRDAVLRVVCDRHPTFRMIPEKKVQFVPWHAETEAVSIGQMHVGLMPLAESAWARGKCGFKMLLYMSCGIPVIVSPVGMNREILSLGCFGMTAGNMDAWHAALIDYYRTPSLGEAHGRQGRQVVRTHFDRSLISKKLAEIFQSLT